MSHDAAGAARSLKRLRDFAARHIDTRTAWKAALTLGLVVWVINLAHGPLAALPAALKQATYTFFVAGFILRLCENLAVKVEPQAAALLLAVLVPSSIAIGLTFLLHSLKGTPEPLASTVPTMLMALPSFYWWGRSSRNGRSEPAEEALDESAARG